MATFSNYSDLCDPPPGPPHPHLCVLTFLVHLPGTQTKTDEVILVVSFVQKLCSQESGRVGRAGRDKF